MINKLTAADPAYPIWATLGDLDRSSPRWRTDIDADQAK
jgi:hypothetical protein